MARKQQKLEPLSSYEETLIWMSYRYAIGRHTIASHSHAEDIVRYSYERMKLDPERCEFAARDINQCIYDQMKFSFFTIAGFSLNTTDINPLDVFFEFINQENIISYAELKKYKEVVAYKDENDMWNFSRILFPDEKQGSYVPRMSFEDLMVWQRLAKMLKLNEYKKVHTLYEGKEEVYECIENYIIDTSKVNLFYKKEYVPVSSYVENPTVYAHIAEEYITKIE